MFSRVQANSCKMLGVMTCGTQRHSGSFHSTETLNGEKLLGVFDPQQTKKHSKNGLPMIYRIVVIIECVPPKVDGDALKPWHKTEPVVVIIYQSCLSYLDAEILKKFTALKHWNSINYWLCLPRMDDKALELYHIAERLDVDEHWVYLTWGRKGTRLTI